jgi:hypothetical protein
MLGPFVVMANHVHVLLMPLVVAFTVAEVD